MRKNAKKRSKKVDSKESESSLKQKLKAYVEDSPAFIAVISMRDKVSEKLLQGFLAFFAFFSPCWNFIFIGTSKPDTDTSKDTKYSNI